MPDRTARNIVTIIVAVVGALVVLFVVAAFVGALFEGRATIPEAVQTQIWLTVVALLTIGSTAIGSYWNSRNLARAREEAKLDAQATQEAVKKVEHAVENGLAERTSNLVKDDAEAAARILAASDNGSRRQSDVDANSAAIVDLGRKLDLLLLATRPAEIQPDATLKAIEHHTAETAENTRQDEGEDDE